jgi:predicted dehydrogenase
MKPSSPPRPSRVAIVGTGHRALTYTEFVGRGSNASLVALCDPSPARMAVHNQVVVDLGRPPATQWTPDGFDRMLSRERIDTVVVTTIDALHDVYTVAALNAGCSVITEKPMTIDVPRCRQILDAADGATGRLSVAFNYRFSAAFETIHQLLHEGVIGDVLSVHFEWLLDVRHGADYFRRWHRDKVNSGGLMVHKASHHFDLVNWWLGSEPTDVCAAGRLAFYGGDNAARRGAARGYVRASGSKAAADDPFALDLAADPTLRQLYLDAEFDNGYVRDQNVFGDGVSIEDDMAVLVQYANGATLTYHLTAYSPYEGCRVAFNGTNGRLELDLEENTWATQPWVESDAARAASRRIRVRPLWAQPREVPVPHRQGGHGGADGRILQALFQPDRTPPEDLAKLATARDGAMALLVGAAANESFATGQKVAIEDLLPGISNAPAASTR